MLLTAFAFCLVRYTLLISYSRSPRYSETTTIHDDVVIMSATGTAATVRDSQIRRRRPTTTATTAATASAGLTISAAADQRVSVRKQSPTRGESDILAAVVGDPPQHNHRAISSFNRHTSGTRQTFDPTVGGVVSRDANAGAAGAAGVIANDDLETPPRDRVGRRGSNFGLGDGSVCLAEKHAEASGIVGGMESGLAGTGKLGGPGRRCFSGGGLRGLFSASSVLVYIV